MEVATQTSLTGLSVLWDMNIDPTAGFFPTDIIKQELLSCDYSDDVGIEDAVRKKIDQEIIKEMEKNKNGPAMTSIDLNILNEYSSLNVLVPNAGKEIVPETNTDQQMGKSNSKFSFVVKSSIKTKNKDTIVSDSERQKVIASCLTLNDLKRLGNLDLPIDNTLKQKGDRMNPLHKEIQLYNKEPISPVKHLSKSSAKKSKSKESNMGRESSEKEANSTEPTVVKIVQNLENQFSNNSSSLKEIQNSKTPTKSTVDSKKISDIENKPPKKKRDWSPSMQTAFKSFCTIKSSPKKGKASITNRQRNRNTPKNKNLNIRKNTKGISKKKKPLVKKTITKSKNETKAAIKSVMNSASSSISNSCNLDNSNYSDDADSVGIIDEIIISDDDTGEIDSVTNATDRNDKSKILKEETFAKKINIEKIKRSEENIGTKCFKCSFCDYESSVKGRLINHIRKHTGIKPFGCEKCDYKCSRKDTLQRHMRLCHSGNKKYKCTECELQFITQEQWEQHLINEHCEKGSFENLNKNMDSKDKINILQKETPEKNINRENIDSVAVKGDMTVDNKQLKCSYCDFQAKSKEKLILHERKHTGEKPFACEKCDHKTSRKDALKSHMRLHSCERMSCPEPECDYATNDKIHFQKHKITHRVEKVFKCTECQTICKTQNSLDKHILSHSANNQFICSECGISYASKNNLKQHMDSEHEQGEVFACSLCSFKCSRKQKLLDHILRHSGVKKFTCSECDLQFISQEQIDRHLLTHALEKPYKCSNCDFSSVDVNGLKSHIKSQHTGELPFHCKDCGRLFSEKKKLRVHRIKKHKFQQKFYCSKCSYQCFKEKHLQDHMQSHLYTDTRTFACSMCDFLCSGILSFKDHMKKHVSQEVRDVQVLD